MDRFSPLRDFFKNQFALDLRSLACFRIGLGALIVVDVMLRLGDLTAFYSDQGIVPRSLLSIGLAYPSQWSFHLMNGTATFQLLLFLVTATAAVMLACGYRTRLVSVVCWLMLVSLHTRNPLVLNAGDHYLELLTFWGIFLPLREYWSFDSVGQETIPSEQVSTLATFALHIQLVLVYLCTGLLKFDIEAWQTGDAIRLALSKDYLVTGIGQWLLAYPHLLTWLTHSTLYLEILGPMVLVLSRGRIRLVIVAIFVLFHIGLAICFSIGFFPYVCIVAFIAFLPSCFWQKLFAKTPQLTANRFYDDRASPLMDVLQKVVITTALLVAVWSNLESLHAIPPMPEDFRSAATAFRLPQSWRLFVDLKEVDNGWFVFHAQFADGTSQDLLTTASPVSYDKPPVVSATFPNFRWRKLYTSIRQEKFKPVATYLGEYLLLERDRTHHDVHNLVGLQISYVKPIADADGKGSELVVFGKPFIIKEPLTQQVLFEWRNEARKYHDAFIRE